MERNFENCTTSTVNPEYLTAAGNKALAEKIKAMREDELEVVVDNIPVEFCLERIKRELDRAKELEAGIVSIISKIGG